MQFDVAWPEMMTGLVCSSCKSGPLELREVSEIGWYRIHFNKCTNLTNVPLSGLAKSDSKAKMHIAKLEAMFAVPKVADHFRKARTLVDYVRYFCVSCEKLPNYLLMNYN